MRATKILQERLLSLPQVEVEWNSVLKKIEGKEIVERVKILNYETGEEKDIPCQGVFIFVGVIPNTEFLKEKVEKDKDGFIIVDKRMKTNCEGIFACGDCTDILPRQVAVASGSAVVASFSAKEYVNKVKGMEYK